MDQRASRSLKRTGVRLQVEAAVHHACHDDPAFVVLHGRVTSVHPASGTAL
jgi:hypothetical protein